MFGCCLTVVGWLFGFLPIGSNPAGGQVGVEENPGAEKNASECAVGIPLQRRSAERHGTRHDGFEALVSKERLQEAAHSDFNQFDFVLEVVVSSTT